MQSTSGHQQAATDKRPSAIGRQQKTTNKMSPTRCLQQDASNKMKGEKACKNTPIDKPGTVSRRI